MTQGLLKAITDPSTGAGRIQGEPENSCYMRIKNVIKDYWDLAKELKSQLEEFPTGQTQDNLSINKDNNCNELKQISKLKFMN